jgi:hypothetical protein
VLVDPAQRWRLLAPPGAELLTARSGRRALRLRLRGLPDGSPVVLTGARSPRRLARRLGLRVLAEYVALPSLAAPVAIVRRDRDTLRYAARTVLTVPSGVTRWHLPAWLAVRLVRTVPGLLAVLPVGDRLVVGERP